MGAIPTRSGCESNGTNSGEIFSEFGSMVTRRNEKRYCKLVTLDMRCANWMEPSQRRAANGRTSLEGSKRAERGRAKVLFSKNLGAKEMANPPLCRGEGPALTLTGRAMAEKLK